MNTTGFTLRQLQLMYKYPSFSTYDMVVRLGVTGSEAVRLTKEGVVLRQLIPFGEKEGVSYYRVNYEAIQKLLNSEE